VDIFSENSPQQKKYVYFQSSDGGNPLIIHCENGDIPEKPVRDKPTIIQSYFNFVQYYDIILNNILYCVRAMIERRKSQRRSSSHCHRFSPLQRPHGHIITNNNIMSPEIYNITLVDITRRRMINTSQKCLKIYDVISYGFFFKILIRSGANRGNVY